MIDDDVRSLNIDLSNQENKRRLCNRFSLLDFLLRLDVLLSYLRSPAEKTVYCLVKKVVV